ncbi:unnamed protein product [Cylicostephanus goldi]|uniref:Uncharacterized protein n=1 Tax=Cylicostephanus goldi TaxID=71465 RepID=A0A3P6QZM0_CYLGO|nr:unnamed protein product [Cylicostephanus goldi]
MALHKTIVLYNSLAGDYHYSARLMRAEDRNILESIWRKVTGRQLAAVIVSGAAHVQHGGSNCSVYVCLYAERLCIEECAVQEDATAMFLSAYRQYIKHRIMSNAEFYRSSNGIRQIVHTDVNANVCFCQSKTIVVSVWKWKACLNDEAIDAIINIVAHGTVFFCLDPCLIQTLESYRMSSYPLASDELLFLFNIRNRAHWDLAWLFIKSRVQGNQEF